MMEVSRKEDLPFLSPDFLIWYGSNMVWSCFDHNQSKYTYNSNYFFRSSDMHEQFQHLSLIKPNHEHFVLNIFFCHSHNKTIQAKCEKSSTNFLISLFLFGIFFVLPHSSTFPLLFGMVTLLFSVPPFRDRLRHCPRQWSLTRKRQASKGCK